MRPYRALQKVRPNCGQGFFVGVVGVGWRRPIISPTSSGQTDPHLLQCGKLRGALVKMKIRTKVRVTESLNRLVCQEICLCLCFYLPPLEGISANRLRSPAESQPSNRRPAETRATARSPSSRGGIDRTETLVGKRLQRPLGCRHRHRLLEALHRTPHVGIRSRARPRPF